MLLLILAVSGTLGILADPKNMFALVNSWSNEKGKQGSVELTDNPNIFSVLIPTIPKSQSYFSRVMQFLN